MNKNTSVYNSRTNGKGIPKEEKPSIYNTSPNKGEVYNKMLEGYIPVPKRDASSELQFMKHGNVVEITLNDKTFAIHDPVRIEGIIKLVEKHEGSLVQIRQNNRTLSAKMQELIQQVNSMKADIKTLQEKLNGGNNYL